MEVLETEDPVRLKAAALLGQNKSRGQVARILEQYLLTPNQRRYTPQRQRLLCLRKIRRWQRNKEFRDLVWAYAVERLDSRTPDILDGVADRAVAGRVDAAKLSLEVAGRYSPKGHDQPTAVQIVVNGVPRPIAIDDGTVIDGTVTAEEG
jgi:hypothetical protein